MRQRPILPFTHTFYGTLSLHPHGRPYRHFDRVIEAHVRNARRSPPGMMLPREKNLFWGNSAARIAVGEKVNTFFLSRHGESG
jgi:hypothetical protein